jgi:hypothetical protein
LLRSARLALVMLRFFWLLMLATDVLVLRSEQPAKGTGHHRPLPTARR